MRVKFDVSTAAPQSVPWPSTWKVRYDIGDTAPRWGSARRLVTTPAGIGWTTAGPPEAGPDPAAVRT